MNSKIGLDWELVGKARSSAARTAEDIQRFIDLHTTVAVERTVCRLLGIDGINAVEVPMPNVVVEHLCSRDLLPDGAALRVGNACAALGISPQEAAEGIDRGEIDLASLPMHTAEEIRAVLEPYITASLDRIRSNVGKRK